MQFGGEQTYSCKFSYSPPPPLSSILERIARDIYIFLKLIKAIIVMNFFWVMYTVEAPNVPILNNEGLWVSVI